MHRKWNGYFTIEATFIMPIILFLYLLIISAALFLYCRCAISQNNFLLAMRGARFTWGEDNYGEAIFGAEKSDKWQAEDYIQERLVIRRKSYPFYPSCDEEYVIVQTRQKASKQVIEKKVQKLNPVEMIREGRKNQNV